MADWKQITARIRRARTSKDPAAQLASLFEKTNDAMAAFELARFFETTGQAGDAGKWYATAAGRFRRSDWKTKAQEAAVRLGMVLPPEETVQRAGDSRLTAAPVSEMDDKSGVEMEDGNEKDDKELQPETSVTEKIGTTTVPASTSASTDEKRPRRRGRRGGRNRRKPGSAQVPRGKENSVTTEPSVPAATRPVTPVAEEDLGSSSRSGVTRSSSLSSEVSESNIPELRGRYGDPGLSSRLTQLEMQFRRLLTCAPSRLNEADQAPVGPGVFVLTDSDLTTYYYVEACQTLRIAVGNLIRSGSSRRGADSLKPQLAEHLGIPETRVTKYLADHCVVRWLQLDEGASHFAHFVIAVLRPKLNE
jgi:hypothetical protein